MARLAVPLLAALAALRVFLFAAAFPFFDNVDEQLQLDLVVKYSHAHFPTRFEPIAPESAALLARYGSPEFLMTLDRAAQVGLVEPLWRGHHEAIVDSLRNEWESITSFESSQPPLYYFVTGACMAGWRGAGLSGAHLLYAVRFVNALLAAALVWLTALAARRFTDDPPMRLAAPLLVAFLPQDTFYGIQSDNLSPLLGAIAFILLLGPFGTRRAFFLGGILAAAYLTKLANAPFVALGLGAVIFRHFRASKLPVLICAMTAVIPIIAWSCWCTMHFGDWTGSAGKIASLTWTKKPFLTWWPHPIFTPRGAGIFGCDLIATFWRGEFAWHGQPLRSFVADSFFIGSTLGFLAFSAVACFRRDERPTLPRLLAFAFIAGGIAFLVWLSLRFDFGRCQYPSAAYPFFTSGRLLGFAVVPVMLLYLDGLSQILRRIRLPHALVAITALIAAFVTISEIAISRDVFASVFNWYHL